MRIKKVSIKDGYKRFHDLTIDLGDHPGRIIALVGPNGSGKSSVLDALVYKQSQFIGTVGNTGSRGSAYHSRRAVDYNGSAIQISFVEGSYGDVIEQKGAAGATLFSFRSPYRYNGALNVSQSHAVSHISANSYGASTAADIDSKVEENYRRLYVAFNDYMHRNDVRPSEAKLKIIGDLNASITKCLDIEISSIGDIEASKGTLYFKRSDHEAEFPFDVLSSGEKEVVDILLDLYLRRESYIESIFLFDEPELHINTSIQKSLLIEINRLVPESCQIWLTTHSIGFLRALQDEFRDDCQVIHFKKDLKLGEVPITLSPIASTHAEWREIFSIALDDLAHLISPRRIIYCEGRDAPGSFGRERGLDAIVYNSVFAREFPDTLFVSSGGNTELDQRSAIAIAIIGKVFPEVAIWVLKDRDMSSGKASTEETRQTYLKLNPDNHRVLRRYEIENYLFDAEILSKYCSAEGLVFDQEAYDKHVSNIDDQNLKDDFNRIKAICGITSSVNAEKFKIALSRQITPETSVYADLQKSIFERG